MKKLLLEFPIGRFIFNWMSYARLIITPAMLFLLNLISQFYSFIYFVVSDQSDLSILKFGPISKFTPRVLPLLVFPSSITWTIIAFLSMIMTRNIVVGIWLSLTKGLGSPSPYIIYYMQSTWLALPIFPKTITIAPACSISLQPKILNALMQKEEKKLPLGQWPEGKLHSFWLSVHHNKHLNDILCPK